MYCKFPNPTTFNCSISPPSSNPLPRISISISGARLSNSEPLFHLFGFIVCVRSTADRVLKSVVQMKREELLEFAQTSISGLKINAQQSRLDVEVVHLKTELSEKEMKIPSVEDLHKPFEQQGDSRSQLLEEAVAQVRIYSKLQELLAQNKTLKSGVSPEAHARKGLILSSDSEKLHSMNLLMYMAPMAEAILLPLPLYVEGNVLAKTVEKARGDWFIVFAQGNRKVEDDFVVLQWRIGQVSIIHRLPIFLQLGVTVTAHQLFDGSPSRRGAKQIGTMIYVYMVYMFSHIVITVYFRDH